MINAISLVIDKRDITFFALTFWRNQDNRADLVDVDDELIGDWFQSASGSNDLEGELELDGFARWWLGADSDVALLRQGYVRIFGGESDGESDNDHSMQLCVSLGRQNGVNISELTGCVHGPNFCRANHTGR